MNAHPIDRTTGESLYDEEISQDEIDCVISCMVRENGYAIEEMLTPPRTDRASLEHYSMQMGLFRNALADAIAKPTAANDEALGRAVRYMAREALDEDARDTLREGASK